MDDWSEAVLAHCEYALVEVEALKSYFNEGDDETYPDKEFEELEEIEQAIKKLRRRVADGN